MRGDLAEGPDVEEKVDVGELIARISAERGLPVEDTGRHRLYVGATSPRSRRRRLAPVIAGVAVVLVASTVALTLRSHSSGSDDPTLDAALVASAPSVTATVPAPLQAEPTASATATAGRPATPTPGATAAARPATVTPPADGVQAATTQGWKLVDRDEFTGPLSDKWVRYDGEGNSGKGRRTPDAITVTGGTVVIKGDAKGNTGGMSFRGDRETGRWEMRAKFPRGDAQYHPVLLLWPKDGGSADGEVDFAETTSASSSVEFFLHHGGDQETAKRQLDLTQWHNYAVEVTADRVTGYVDGQKWFESTDRDTLPREAVHPVIQLDWFPKGDSPEPSEMLVDWMRIYE